MDSPCSPPKPKRARNDAFASSHTAADDLNPNTVRLIHHINTSSMNESPPTSVPPVCCSFDDAVTLASTHVWNVPELRPLQMQAIKHVLMPSTPNTLFLIDRTGGGKSHVIRTLGAILKGIIIVFIPILSLSADLLEKFQTASQRFGSVHAHHVDEIIDASPDKRSELLIRINSMQRETTSTLFLFLSPQLMIHHTDFRDALIRQCRAGVVRLVTIDEAHLYVQHGISFRSKIRMMKNIFFNKVFHPTMKIKPAFIAATATMNHPFIAQLTSLTTIKFPPRSIIWPPSFQFRQRSINMVFTTSHEYAKAGLNYVVEFLQENPGRCACVFVNSRFKSHDIVSKLEEKLNHCAIKSDVVHIHGRQFKEEKFHFIRMFCANSHVVSYQPDILVATSAANVGIDHHLVDLVVRFGFPRDLMTYFQERGRCARIFGTLAKCILMADTWSYVDLMFQVLMLANSDQSEPKNCPVVSVNSAIKLAPNTNQHTKEKEEMKFALTVNEKRMLKDQNLRDISEVLRFFCLDYGCQHALGEWIMARGKFEYPPPCVSFCETSCSVCNKEWHKCFLPVYRDSVSFFLESSIVTESMPLKATHDSLPNILWNSAAWMNKIYDKAKSSVARYNVESLMLQLIAKELIVLQRRTIGGSDFLYWNISKKTHEDGSETPLHRDKSLWVGITLFDVNRKRKFKERKKKI